MKYLLKILAYKAITYPNNPLKKLYVVGGLNNFMF